MLLGLHKQPVRLGSDRSNLFKTRNLGKKLGLFWSNLTPFCPLKHIKLPLAQELSFCVPALAQADRVQAEVVSLGVRILADELKPQGVLPIRQSIAAHIFIQDAERGGV
jgi:hypothetical protein